MPTMREVVAWDPDDITTWADKLSQAEPALDTWLGELARIACNKGERISYRINALYALRCIPPSIFSKMRRSETSEAVMKDLLWMITTEELELRESTITALINVVGGYVNFPWRGGGR